MAGKNIVPVFGEKSGFVVHTVVNMTSPVPVIYPVTRVVNEGDDKSASYSLLDSSNNNKVKYPSLSSRDHKEKQIRVEQQNNLNNNGIECHTGVIEGQQIRSAQQPECLGPAEKMNVENNRLKYFSGLKSNLQADLETFGELLWALCYFFYGVTVSIILTFIPRRFRYKDVSGQVVLITGAGSGIGRMMAKKLALSHGATIVAWDINKQGKGLRFNRF